MTLISGYKHRGTSNIIKPLSACTFCNGGRKSHPEAKKPSLRDHDAIVNAESVRYCL